ncbi:hypoxia up-regulated protein 1 [Episyrphus balteatus]|uniref:hypoxia up-regulated protein 1 n=1 Tax=Episyrphus balteatus TaxID=286459 RepID=UPI002485E3D2|nr:hypoxia up-regulated protein 1 [Episyrphus balteatus]
MVKMPAIPCNGLRAIVILTITLCGLQMIDSAAVMSVDLGSEWMKVGVVSPGVPMEIALNKESKRKSPAVLAFRDGVRSFGEDAQTVGVKEPASAYAYLLDLLGKQIDNPIVDLYRKRFPYYEIVGDEERNTVLFKKGDEYFSVEELVAQILVKAREFAEDSTSQPITECVLIVPGFFGQAERQALLSAAQLANLKVLQLINDYTAVALNYGVFHRAEINETAQYFIFYDMGAQKTSAAVVSYQLVKDKQTKETNPVVQVLGVGYDRTLGGLDAQLRLRDYLAKEFNSLGKTKTDVTKNNRAMAKLFKEAARLKNVLSANMDHYAQIENLIEDHDFKLQVTREIFEELCADLWPRSIEPLKQALKSSGLSLDMIKQVILFGGGTRVPKVQEILKEYLQQDLGKSLNADEAATMGAVYKAADLATGFKVKKFLLKDAVILPIHVSFERDPGDGASVRQVKRVLFGPMSSYPQKKVITFNKHTSDFEFYAHYGDLSHLSPEEISYVGSMNLTNVQLVNVKETLEKNSNEIVDSKGIKSYFVLDDSGLFSSTGVEFVYEKQKSEKDDADIEGTLAKLGSTISKLFSNSDDEKKDDEENPKPEQGEGEKPSESQKQEKAEKEENIPKKEENKTDEKAPKNNTVKIVTTKEPIEYKLTLQYTKPLEGEGFEKSLKKLTAINKVESERVRLESAFNALESHVIETQEKLSRSEYANCATEEEKAKILEECSTISEWLYEDGADADANTYENKLDELKKLTNVVLGRHWEHEERPEAVKALNGLIEGAKGFLEKAKNLTKATNPERDIFTEVEVTTLSKIIEETATWRTKEVAAQKKLKRNQELRLTVKDITDKMALLDREVQYLVNKIKIWKPKAKPTVTETKTKPTEGDEEEEPQEATEEEPESNEEKSEKPTPEEVEQQSNDNAEEASHAEL